MRSLKLRGLMLCVGTMLTLGLSHTAAQACAQIVAGDNVYGKYDCRLTASCELWCEYSCTCSDLFPGYSCDNVLVEAGFILSDTPKCFN